MQRKDVLTLVIAIGSGVFAFILVMNVMNKPARIGEKYVIAARDIAAGDVLDETAIAMSEPMTGKDRTTLFLLVQDAVNMKALEPIKQGALIQRSQVKVHVRDEVAEALAELPEGMRAMTISAGSVDPMPELLKVGGFVDVIGKVQASVSASEARVLYRSAKVVSIKKNDTTGDIVSLTIALDGAGAEAVARALLQGKLGLIVRSGEGSGEDSGVAPGLDQPVKKPAPEETTTEIIRGVDKVMVKTAKNVSGEAPAQDAKAAVEPT